MKIGIVGGTGDIGEGMALRLSSMHEVILGSREVEKACSMSDQCTKTLEERGVSCSLRGVTNQQAVDGAEIVVLALPFRHVAPTLATLSGFEEKVVISPVNPIEKPDHFVFAPPAEGSAALLIRKLLPRSAKVVAAFNNIAANRWKAIDGALDYSVAVCGDDPAAKKLVMDLANGVPNLTAFDVGPLAVSPMVEAVTPLLLDVAKYSRMRDVGIQFR